MAQVNVVPEHLKVKKRTVWKPMGYYVGWFSSYRILKARSVVS